MTRHAGAASSTQLGVTDPALMTWESVRQVRRVSAPARQVKKGAAHVPAAATSKKELESIAAERAAQAAAPEKPPEAPKKPAAPAKAEEAPAGPIGIEDFAKVKLIAAKVHRLRTACAKSGQAAQVHAGRAATAKPAPWSRASPSAYSPEEMRRQNRGAGGQPGACRKLRGVLSPRACSCALRMRKAT